jgi:transposase
MFLISSEDLLGLPNYEITKVHQQAGTIQISAHYKGPVSCPHCCSTSLRSKGLFQRAVRHESAGMRAVVLILEGRKWLCKTCSRQFRQSFPGVLKCQRSTEPFRRMIFFRHWDGISRSRLAQREGIGSATVERYFQYFLQRLSAERSHTVCPRLIGIDEHFFSRRQGYATTLCDLRHHKVFDVVLGRSEAALESYFNQLKGKNSVLVVCMDLSSTYRALVRKHFPNAMIVADRFHVVRLLNHHFMAVWKQLDPLASKNRGLISLMRRHAENLSPDQRDKLRRYLAENAAIQAVYDFKQQTCRLLLYKHRTANQCRVLIPQLLDAIEKLRSSPFASMQTVGETFASWKQEIARMWRFTRNNAITEGFHTKMEVLQRQADGFRSFKNYRLRVRVMCS